MEHEQATRTRRLPPSQVNCKWWMKGHCFRGETCYFRHDEEFHGRDMVPRPDQARESRTKTEDAHVATESGPSISNAPVPEPEKCGICLEVPVTYGLLVNCDHVFCLECLREWRSSKNNRTRSPYSDDGPELRNPTKTCPLCRVGSEFIVPSTVFPTPPKPTEPAPEAANDSEAGQEQGASQPSKPKNPAKEKIVNGYLARLKNIPCKYFEEGVKRWRDAQRHSLLDITPELRPVCYFGNSCHYAHKHPISGEPYVFSPQEIEAIEQKRARRRRSHSGGLFASLDPRTFENMMEAFGQFLETDAPSMMAAGIEPPPMVPAILRALQEESLRQMGATGIQTFGFDDDDDFGVIDYDDDWEDYTADEESEEEDDNDLPDLIPVESRGSPPEPDSNDGAGFEDLPDLISLNGDSDDDASDLPDLISLKHGPGGIQSSAATRADSADDDSGDMPNLINLAVGASNTNRTRDLIEFDS